MTTPPATSGPSAADYSFLDLLPASGPAKKPHTGLILLIITLALILVGIAGYVATIGGTSKTTSAGITETSAEVSLSQQAEDGRSAARRVRPGKAFSVGGHKTLAGWAVKRDTRLGAGPFNITGKVKNIGNSTSTALIHFKFIDSHGDVLGNVQCNSVDLKPGQARALSCIPDGKYGKYKEVIAEALY